MRLNLRYAVCLTFLLLGLLAESAFAAETYGPINLLKMRPNPFNASDKPSSSSGCAGELMPLSLGGASNSGAASGLGGGGSALSRHTRSLSERLVTSRLYLPGRMVMGKTAEFVVKGKPGSHVALAMADKDSGARSIYGHTLHLGPDRKVVAVGDIPESGVLDLYFETPIEGDLIGEHLFFEAAIWTRNDYSDLEMATPVSSEGQEGVRNGVVIAQENEKKTGLKFTQDTTLMQQRLMNSATPLDSGQP